MKNSSLNEAVNIIIEALDNSNKIDKIDKAELMLNITHFLKENEYRENIKILSRRNSKWKKH